MALLAERKNEPEKKELNDKEERKWPVACGWSNCYIYNNNAPTHFVLCPAAAAIYWLIYLLYSPQKKEKGADTKTQDRYMDDPV